MALKIITEEEQPVAKHFAKQDIIVSNETNKVRGTEGAGILVARKGRRVSDAMIEQYSIPKKMLTTTDPNTKKVEPAENKGA